MIDARNQLSTLYQEDFVSWIDETTRLMKKGDIAGLDWEHITLEIEGLGSEQRHKVDSYLLQLLIHLLLYKYWHSEREWSGRGWSNEINNFRVQLELLFESRTLYVYCLERTELIYSKAVKQSAFKSKLDLSLFSENCPFTPEEIFNFEFFPIIEESNLT